MSCCGLQLDQFLRDPYSSLKVLLPTGAIEAILHCKVWSDKTTRTLAVCLLATSVGRMALNGHLGWIETPIINRLPFITEDQKLLLNVYRQSFIQKLDLITGIVSLDIFYIYSNRIGIQVPSSVTTLMVAPVVISAIQGMCLLPNFHRQVARLEQGRGTSAELYNDSTFVNRHRIFLGMDAVKVTCLAVAGLRFGCLLSK